MFSFRQTSVGGGPQSPRPDHDSDSASATRTDNSRKRPRLGDGREDQRDPLPAACNQCRLRKVRCDRLQPECSNCRKGGIECNSSSTLKRVNHVKELRDDFSNVLKQLNDVDHALGILTEITRQITVRPCSHTINPYSPPNFNTTSPDALPPSTSGLINLSQLAGLDERRKSQAINTPLSETVQLGHGRERLYSYPAPLVLVKSLFHEAEKLLADSDQQNEDHEGDRGNFIHDPAARAALQQKLEYFPFITMHRELVLQNDTSSLSTPPRLMVNLFVNGYLENINTRTPIFNDENLHNIIDAHYNDKELQDSGARALIINNIILLELSLEIKTGRASRPSSRIPNNDILPSFLRNCDRAISNLDIFKAPTIVSLQALMTLTLVAQEFYTNGIAERVTQAACQVGRIMGVHRSKENHQCETRARLFRVLYAMDKTRVFMTGQPCDLYLFDSDQDIGPDHNRQGDDHSVIDAFDHLMTIWEEIYLNLYSSGASRSDMSTRLNQMRFVASSINRFSQTHAKLLSPCSSSDTADTDLLRLELRYGYQVSQILILRCDQDDEQSLTKMRDLSRSSLEMILEVCQPPMTTARFALLSRIFRRYPVVAFVELAAFYLNNCVEKDEFDRMTLTDIALLRSVCDQLQLLHYDNLTHSFYTRLGEGLLWAVETLEALTEPLTRPPSPKLHPQVFSQQIKDDSRITTAESSRVASPDMFDSRIASPSQENHGFSQLTASHHPENNFIAQSSRRSVEPSRPGYFAPQTEPVEFISVPSSPNYRLDSSLFAASQSQLELTSEPLPNDVNWGAFSLDFLQGTFAQGSRWD
ncbi:hypothetical protein F5Y03DRAFT_116245 [Xylaria venustula]|nr:hypothetical protein F5Y03DRAFT_116245 [Xylaria venustula]